MSDSKTSKPPQLSSQESSITEPPLISPVPSTTKPTKPALKIPISSSTTSRPKSQNTPAHIRSRSIDLDALREKVQNSPVARRMSMSVTSQDALDDHSGILGWLLKREGLIIGLVCAGSLITGTALSLLYKTSLSTSISSTPLSTAYLAQKSNFVNQYLVKLAWLHTSAIYLLHLFTSPSGTPKFRRFSIYLLATAFWAGFTNWFFGAGLGDRIIELSGGACALIIPSTFASTIGGDLGALKRVIPGSELLESESGEGALLHLPSTFCTLRKPLTQSTHPELFDLLSESITNVADQARTSAISSMPSQLSSLIPRWRKGFDISGHAFLLTLAAIVLSRELAPTWRKWAGIRTQSHGRESRSDGGVIGVIHLFSGVMGTALMVIWIGMLGVTGLYFHDPPEKVSGLVLGLTAGALLNLAPSSPFSPPPSAYIAKRKSKPNSNENRARRGDIVDDGVVLLSPFAEDDEDDSGEENGRIRSATGLEKKVLNDGAKEKAE